MTQRVVVVGTGGTIASTDAEGGARPTKAGEELVEAVPGLSDHADVSVENVARVPGFEMSFEVMADVADEVRAADDDGAAGVVVTHGTDTLEETAYFLDLTVDRPLPVVVTGAQRRPDEVSSDGPANLLLAVRAAAHDRFRGTAGAYVAANDRVYAARDATKRHTSRPETFTAPDAGPVALASRSGLRVRGEPGSHSASMRARAITTTVPIVTSAASVGRRAIDRFVEDGVDGIVLQGTGLGNATPGLCDAVGDAIEAGVPVAVASRCFAGATEPVYGANGGGRALASRGAVFAGDLPAWKARIKLALACEAADAPGEIEAAFETGGVGEASRR